MMNKKDITMNPTSIPHRIDYHHAELGDFFDKNRISPGKPQSLKHRQLEKFLQKFAAEYPKDFKLEKLGGSVEDRSIYHVTMGHGPRTIMMWSQMHGNEPTATNAIVDIFNFLLTARESEFVREILDGATIHFIPMLNPDGSEVFLRRNAQGLDLNRDARELASPEARILKGIYDRLKPEFGLNLHDMNGRRTIEVTNKLIAIALLVPPYDENKNNNPARIDAKRLASVMQQALSPYIYEHISRYDADYMPSSFGDNFQSWGMRTVLLETGGWYQDGPEFLVKLNFIAILEACHAIATESYQHANPGLYDALPLYDKELFDLMIKRAKILDGSNPEPFSCDLGVNFIESVQNGKIVHNGVFTDIGDMRNFTAKQEIDGSELLVLPGLIGLLPPDCTDRILDDSLIQDYMKRGYTTLLVEYDLQRNDRLKNKIEQLKKTALRINVGYVVSMDTLANIPLNEQATALGDALADGAIAVLEYENEAHEYHPLTEKIVNWLHMPRFKTKQIRANKNWVEMLQSYDTTKSAKHVLKKGILGRGRIRINDTADLVVFKLQEKKKKIDVSGPEYVFINGRMAYSRNENDTLVKAGLVIHR
ncbi:MAG: hypothetical protein DWQ10_03565 [Calditrichaeota bacterium]|nr:MAG: hypothetical protein DWQ10_03565 [Calditrichota bacterium]